MKQIKLLIISSIILLNLVSLALAVTTTPTPIFLNPEKTFENVNFNGVNSTIQVTLDPFSLSEVVSMNSETISLQDHWIVFSIKENAPSGSYGGKIRYGSDSTFISIFVGEEDEPIDPDACRLNPTLVTYTQTVQSNTEFELPKITFNPKNCNGEFSIESPYISGGITTNEGQKPIYIKSSSSTEITLGVNTKELSSAPYKSTLTLSAFDQTFSDVSTINIIVTGGTNPDTNFNVNNLPTCSLTTNILNLNNTYGLVCTRITPGVSIYPIVDTNYIKGIGPGDDMTSTNFVWEFQPKNMGNTFIVAEFRYLDLPVGNPFSQEVKIQSSGSQTQGTDLTFHFTPSLLESIEGQQIIVQLIDNKTKSLVERPEIYLNSIKISPLNISDKSFQLDLEINKDYELRGVAPGYSNIIQTIKITPNKIGITINPTSGGISTSFNITTSVNATLKVNGINYSNPYYGFLPAGLVEIEASKEGYNTGKINITITDYIRATKIGEIEFKKGKIQNFTLTGNVSSWVIYFQKDVSSTLEELIRGYGNEVSFTPKKNGVYTIQADGSNVQNGVYQTEGLDWSKKWWFMAWWIWIASVLVLGIIVTLVILKVRGGGGSYNPGFRSAPINYE